VALVEGSLWMATGSNGEAAAALTRALRSGLALGLDGLAAEAAARRLFVIGEGQGRREAALEGEAVAEALAERARDERVTALLHNNLGVVLAAADQAERARGHYLQAIDLLGRGEGPKDPLIGVAHHNLGGLAREQLQLDAAREHYTEAIRRFGELLGEGHPYVTHAVSGLAEVDVLAGRLEAAAAGFTRSLALMEAAYGAGHEYLMFPLIGLGQVRGLEGDHEAATRLFRRAVALGEQTKSVNFLKALVGLAGEVEAADPTEARRLVERAISAAPGEEGSMLAELLVRAGRLAVRTGDVAAARERFERVLAVTTGRKEQVKERGQAALELARLTNETAQACALLAEAKAVDETRVEATALLASRCAGR
jgi:tetratricopeptide (TPR) repeat protein